jgi:hypothetical protein
MLGISKVYPELRNHFGSLQLCLICFTLCFQIMRERDTERERERAFVRKRELAGYVSV